MTMTVPPAPVAVITGASSGTELAREFAEYGYDLLMVAEDSEFRTMPGSEEK